MLEVDAVQKHFGGIRAVVDASLVIDTGEVHALIGPNGAGKTTMFNLVSGMFAPDAGTVRLHGEEIRDLPPHRICERGLARSFQITNLFRGLSIRENLRLSLQARHPGRFNAWRDVDGYPEIHAETAELIGFLGLEGIEEIAGRRALLRRAASAGRGHRSLPPSRRCSCWTSRWRASRPPSASACRTW